MKILVCFTEAPDFDTLSESAWQEHLSVKPDFTFNKKIFNGYDESALEWSLKLGDQLKKAGKDYGMTALTVGGNADSPFLKTLNALPFEKVVNCDYTGDKYFSPEAITECISSYIKTTGGFDLILTGKSTSTGANGLTPVLLANKLQTPFLSNVSSLEWENGNLRLLREVDGGVLSQLVGLPLVLSIGNSKVNYLRVPTLKNRIEASKKEIVDFKPEVDSYEQTGILLSLKREQKVRKCKFLTAETASEKAAVLFKEYLQRGNKP